MRLLCPLRVRHQLAKEERPLYPSKRTSRYGSIGYILNCDPRNCPVEKTRQKDPLLGRGLRLSALFRQNRRQLVAKFRASSGVFGEGSKRARKATTRWLC
jgi:hypothetical protein